jgi:outer membrane protein TolC
MKSLARKGFGIRSLVCLAVLPFLLSSCLSREQAVEEVDREAYGLIAEQTETLFGEPRSFSIDPNEHRIVSQVVDPETGLVRPEASLDLDLATILEVAAVNSRNFQDQKEVLYRAALAFMREKEAFRNRPAGIFEGSATAGPNDRDTIAAGSEFGISNLIERGGSYALSLGLDFFRVVSSPTSENLTSFLNLSISLPFLRNAGREIATENLIQSERDLLYSVRSFERFRQTYGTDVIIRDLRVLSQKERIAIAEANYRSLRRAREEVEERYKEGRVSRVEVDQNFQAELSGENRVVNARQDLEASLDSLKDFLGLPVDLPVAVRSDDLLGLDTLVEEDFQVEEKRAMKVAFVNRLDLRNAVDIVADAGRRVVVAENQLLPDLTLNLSATPVSKNLKPLKYNFQDGTYAASFDMDLGLDRDLESIALRQAIIQLEESLRNQEEFREGTKLDVREALRQLDRARQNYRITKQGFDLAVKRVESTAELRIVGRASTRDFLESQDSLVSSENDLLDRKVDYRIAFLELFRDTGTLVVAPKGLDHETSRTMLLEE